MGDLHGPAEFLLNLFQETLEESIERDLNVNLHIITAPVQLVNSHSIRSLSGRDDENGRSVISKFNNLLFNLEGPNLNFYIEASEVVRYSKEVLTITNTSNSTENSGDAFLQFINSVLNEENTVVFIAAGDLREHVVFLLLTIDAEDFQIHKERSRKVNGDIPHFTEHLIDELLELSRQYVLSYAGNKKKFALRDTAPSVLRQLSRRIYSDVMREYSKFEYQANELANQVDQLNRISELTYEKSNVSGSIFMLTENDKHHITEEKTMNKRIPLTDSRSIRKLLQGLPSNRTLLCDGKDVYGIGTISSQDQRGRKLYYVEFSGRGRWSLKDFDDPLFSFMHVKHGRAYLYGDGYVMPEVAKKIQESFSISNKTLEAWETIIRTIARNGKGALLVIQDHEMVANEARRLGQPSLSFQSFEATEDILPSLSQIDGAVLLDPNLNCYAIGVILDGIIKPKKNFDDPARGARYNSAVRYRLAYPDINMVIIVISVDGMINVIPSTESSAQIQTGAR